MNSENFSVFRKSINQSVIDDIAELFDAHKIIYKRIDNSKVFEPTFVIDPSKFEYQILIHRDDFEQAG